MKLKHKPLPLAAASLAFGIALSAFLPSPGFALLLLLLLGAAISYFLGRRHVASVADQFCGWLLLASFVAGGWALGGHSATIPPSDPSYRIGETVTLTGHVVDDVKQTKFGFKTVLDCEAPFTGKVLLELPAQAEPPRVNDRLLAEVTLKDLPNQLPGYTSWLHHQGIHSTARCHEFNVQGREGGIWAVCADFRADLAAAIRSCFPSPETAGLCNAMLLGDRSGLDTAVKKEFAATGLSHIVAISGMNFAIIYLALCFLLKPLLYLRRGRQIRSLIVIPTLILFAIITGANPAIVRAAIMLSIIDLGKSFWQQSNSYTALSAAAFGFLVWEPQALFSPDFQLSYAAVLGILLLQNPILHYFHRRAPWMPKALASAMAVTLAAQVATTPLVAWHFQTFPTYFLLANLLVLPIVTVVVQLGFAGFALVWIPGLGQAWGGCMDFLLWAVTSLASLVAQLPGATIASLSPAESGIWILLGQAAAFIGLMERQRIVRWLRGSSRKAHMAPHA